MIEETTQLLFKILTGRHSGAQLPLAVGEYILGSGDECDIILLDDGVQEEHCCLSVEQDGIKLLPRTGTVLVQGAEVIESGTLLHLYQAAIIGGAAFALGIEGDEWPEIKVGEQSSNDTSSDHPVDNDDEETKEEKSASQAVIRQPSIGKSTRVWGIALILIVLLITVSVQAYLNQPEEYVQSLPDLSEQVTALLHREEVPSLSLQRKDNELIISGFVGDQKTRREITEKISTVAPDAVVNIIAIDSLVSSVTQILTVYGYRDLEVSTDLNGMVTIKGEVKNSREFEQVVDSISRDVPMVTSINNKTTEIRKVSTSIGKITSFPGNKVMGVVIGKTSFICMQNGVIYNIGSRVPGNCSIHSISRQTVLLDCDGTRKTYPILP